MPMTTISTAPTLHEPLKMYAILSRELGYSLKMTGEATTRTAPVPKLARLAPASATAKLFALPIVNMPTAWLSALATKITRHPNRSASGPTMSIATTMPQNAQLISMPLAASARPRSRAIDGIQKA